MSKYIDLDKAITIFDVRGRKSTTTVFQILDRNGAIYETADVVERKHGKWVEDEDGCLCCSLCGNPCEINCINGEFIQSPYCSECGARMVSDNGCYGT